jgi:transposase
VATVDDLHQIIAEQRAQIADLQRQVAELQRRLNQSSQNSSRPPSSDAPHVKPLPKQSRSKRKPGGQPGHKRNERSLLPAEQVDELVEHWPQWCADCHSEMPSAGRIEIGEAERHQVTELPVAKAHVTEHRLHTQHCEECGCATIATLPDWVPTGAFGPRLQAVTSLLTGVYRLSKRTAQEALSDLFGVSMALGSVSACEQVVSHALAEPVAEAREYARGQKVGHADETGWVEGRGRAWLWVLATALVTVFQIHRRRSKEAAQALLGTFSGVLVSDRWAAYNEHDPALRQICWSHLARDFVALSEYSGAMGEIGQKLVDETVTMFRLWHRVRDGTLSRIGLKRKMKPVRKRIEKLLVRGTRTGVSKAAGMCEQIAAHSDSLWTFVRIEDVPPTNNDAERALRFAVLWRKGSFGTHSEAGSRFVERILTARTSLRQQHRNVTDYITRATEAHLAGFTVPSLLPQP